jgi:prepilin-type N-terminal cleavage/methylation domain-containing protein
MLGCCRNIRGYSLIELVISLSIIVILAGILLPQFMKIRYRAHYNICTQYERNLAVSLEMYKIENYSVYPAENNLKVLWEMYYISNRPVCPTDGERQDYGYKLNTELVTFTLFCRGVHIDGRGLRPKGYPQYSSINGLDLGDEVTP